MSIQRADLVLSLKDRVSGPARGIDRSLDRLDRKTRNVERHATMGARMRAGVGRAAAGIGALGAPGFLAPAAIAYGAGRAFSQFADVERRLTRIGLTAGKSREEAQALRVAIEEIGKDYSVGSDAVMDGLDALTAAGLSLDEAMGMLRSTTATAYASGANLDDIAKTAVAVGRNFGMMGKEAETAFDILTYAGQAGEFELKDMARYLPSLAPAFKALGYEGKEGLAKLAAMLQAVRKGVGTSEEAAVSTMEIIQKLESTATRNNFKKFGVDLTKELEKAKEAGEDVLDAFLDITEEALDGDLSKIPQLFTDKQFAIGMRAMLTNRASFERETRDFAANAGGTVAMNVKVLDEDAQRSIDDLRNAFIQMVTEIGATAAKVLVPVFDGITDDLQAMRKADAYYGDKSIAERAATSFQEMGLFRERYGILDAPRRYREFQEREGGRAMLGKTPRSAEDYLKVLDQAVAAYNDPGREGYRPAAGAGTGEAPQREVSTDPGLPTPPRQDLTSDDGSEQRVLQAYFNGLTRGQELAAQYARDALTARQGMGGIGLGEALVDDGYGEPLPRRTIITPRPNVSYSSATVVPPPEATVGREYVPTPPERPSSQSVSDVAIPTPPERPTTIQIEADDTDFNAKATSAEQTTGALDGQTATVILNADDGPFRAKIAAARRELASLDSAFNQSVNAAVDRSRAKASQDARRAMSGVMADDGY